MDQKPQKRANCDTCKCKCLEIAMECNQRQINIIYWMFKETAWDWVVLWYCFFFTAKILRRRPLQSLHTIRFHQSTKLYYFARHSMVGGRGFCYSKPSRNSFHFSDHKWHLPIWFCFSSKWILLPSRTILEKQSSTFGEPSGWIENLLCFWLQTNHKFFYAVMSCHYSRKQPCFSGR